MKLKDALTLGDDPVVEIEEEREGRRKKLLIADLSRIRERKTTPRLIESLIKSRSLYRSLRLYQEADAIRDELKRRGITLRDLGDATLWINEAGLE